jgi:hypothetical protein
MAREFKVGDRVLVTSEGIGSRLDVMKVTSLRDAERVQPRAPSCSSWRPPRSETT